MCDSEKKCVSWRSRFRLELEVSRYVALGYTDFEIDPITPTGEPTIDATVGAEVTTRFNTVIGGYQMILTVFGFLTSDWEGLRAKPSQIGRQFKNDNSGDMTAANLNTLDYADRDNEVFEYLTQSILEEVPVFLSATGEPTTDATSTTAVPTGAITAKGG